MPNVIITPGFAALRARLKEDQYGAIAQGVAGTADIVAGALLDYATRRRVEDSENLGLLFDMTKAYGDKVGTPALEEMDHLLKKRNLPGLPRDTVTGKPMAPPKTLDQLISSAAEKDPELLAGAAQRKLLGVSPLQMAMQRQKLEAQDRHNRTMEEIAQLRVTAERERIQAGRETAETRIRMQQLDRQLKVDRLEFDKAKAGEAFTLRAQSSLFGAVKAWGAKGTTGEQRKILRPVLHQGLLDAGVSPENADVFLEGPHGWIDSFIGLFSRNKQAVAAVDQHHMQQGIQTYNIPGQIRTKSGKILKEEVIPEGGSLQSEAQAGEDVTVQTPKGPLSVPDWAQRMGEQK